MLAASLVCLAWLFGPELILSSISVQGELSPEGKMQYRLWKVVTFLVANGVVIYALLSRARPRAAAETYDRQLTESCVTGVAYADDGGVLGYANTSFLRMFDLSSAVIGQVTLQDMLRERVDGMPPGGFLPIAGGLEVAARTRLGDGRQLEMVVSVTANTGEGGGYLVSASEVSELRALRANKALIGAALDVLPQTLTICDVSRAGLPIVYANGTAERMTGYPPTELIGAPWNLLQGPDRDQKGLTEVRTAIEQQHGVTVVLRNHRKDGSSFLNEVSVCPVIDHDLRLTHVAFLQRDITEEQSRREAIDRTLHHDSISSLLNRAGLVDALGRMLSGGTAGHVLMLKADIRNFHEFNTAAGWDAGDALLAEVGKRLARALPSAAVGRLAADLYGLAMPVALAEVDETVQLARQAIQGRYTIPGAVYDPMIAIGYTVASTGSFVRSVMQQSSVALKEATRDGHADVRRFDREMEREVSERRRLTAELQQAISDRNFDIHFLPEVELGTGRVIAAEALVRWLHPLFGMQQPSGFIELAEQTGLILDIGQIVLAKAASFAGRINGEGRPTVAIAVNMSMTELRQPGIVQSIEAALAQAGARPGWLQLDLTESTIATAPTAVLATLDQLRALGVGLAIDDFGAGHGSLNHLARIAVNKIKVDRCFTRDIGRSSINQAVLRAILDIGALQDATVVAEGVETDAERRALLDLGCTSGQGFLFSRPISEADLQRLLSSGGVLTAA